MLFAKTLVRKNVASSVATTDNTAKKDEKDGGNGKAATDGGVKLVTNGTEPPIIAEAEASAETPRIAEITEESRATTPTVVPAKKDDEGEFSSKAQVMTLMTTDVGSFISLFLSRKISANGK